MAYWQVKVKVQTESDNGKVRNHQELFLANAESATEAETLAHKEFEGSGYWMQIQLRSSKGFKYSLIPHYGCVDAGYTGDLGVKIYNVGDEDVVIEGGERYAQIAVIPKPNYYLIELNSEEYQNLKGDQSRGDGGFGSSGK
jgi:dUTPase